MKKLIVFVLVVTAAYFGFKWSSGDWDWESGGTPLDQVEPADPNLTTMVATLDHPIDPHQNVMWCATFLVACDELRDAQSEIPGLTPDSVLEILERAGDGRAVLPEGDYLAFGGRNDPELLAEEARRLEERFPDHVMPSFAPDIQWIGYCFLHTRAKFSTRFREDPKKLIFTDSKGTPTPVRSFGYEPQDFRKNYRSTQVAFLFHDPENSLRNIVTLDRSADLEVVAIGSPQGSTLAEAWMEAKSRMASADYSYGTGVLAVPEIGFSLRHEFPEIFDQDPDAEGCQDIWFALDETGAEVRSRTSIKDAKGGPPRPDKNETLFDRPFLLVMRVRGQEDPFFALWVRNADILIRR